MNPTTPPNPSSSMKRTFDVVMALAALLLLAPLFAVVALWIWATDLGVPFFTQTRVGKNGRQFKVYKFRIVELSLVGAFIRATNISRLPQLWNVLAGDMSVVGPRPASPAEVARDTAWVRRRLSLTPGIIDVDLIDVGLMSPAVARV